jgi:hypothetical protein
VTGRLEEVERKEDGGSSPLRELQIIGLPGHSNETFTYEQAQTKFDFINTTNLPLHYLEKMCGCLQPFINISKEGTI